jgi:hypothetical protein
MARAQRPALACRAGLRRRTEIPAQMGVRRSVLQRRPYPGIRPFVSWTRRRPAAEACYIRLFPA